MSARPRPRLVGRRVLCCYCAHNFVRGVSCVFRYVLFHFSAECVTEHRGKCEQFMREVAA